MSAKPTMNHVLAKAQGIYTGLSNLPKENLGDTPEAHFAHDYNSLRNLAADFPSLMNLLPPPVEIEKIEGAAGTWERPDTTFASLLSYVTQIVNLLGVELDSEPEPTSK